MTLFKAVEAAKEVKTLHRKRFFLVFASTCIGLFAVTAIAVALVHSSGSKSAASETTADLAGASEPGGAIDWDHPFTDGVNVPSVAAAGAVLPLTPVAPQSLGSPAKIVVHDPTQTPPDQAGVALVYHSPKYGTFEAIEDVTRTSETELAALAAGCDPSNGCEGTWKMVDLAGGKRALLVAGPQTTGLIWVDNGHRFDVYGPSGSFSVSTATSVANTFVSNAS